jgi:integration host factor subunit beta
MTKSELIEAVAEKAGIPKARAELLVNGIFDAMGEALARGEGIELRGFGSFTVRTYEPYEGRNPKTGETVQVKAKKLPFFKVAKELKARVDAGRGRHSLAPEAPGDEDEDEDDALTGSEDREESAE